MSGTLQQFPNRKTSFQGSDGLINPVWYNYLHTQWQRLGGGSSDATIASLQTQVDTLALTKVAKSGDTMSGPLILPGVPAASLGAAPKSYTDAETSARVAAVSAEAGTRAAADALLTPLAGGTMTGLLLLSGVPAVALGAATKGYVDTAAALKLPLAGGTLTGPLILSGAPTTGLNPTTKTYVDAADALALPLTGGTLSGALTVPSVVTTPTTAAALPGSPTKGERAFVTDATVATFWSSLTGGGANNVPVVFDGTQWRIG